jgi:hypothetical protein
MAFQEPASITRRILIIITILICIFLSCTYFYNWGEANHPSTTYVTSHPDEFYNETLAFNGEIIKISKPSSDPDNGSKDWFLTIESDEIELDLIVEDSKLNTDPKKGDHVNCKGIYLQNNTIAVTKIHTSDQTLVNLIFIRSGMVIPILIAIFILSWKLNLKKFFFEMRR